MNSVNAPTWKPQRSGWLRAVCIIGASFLLASTALADDPADITFDDLKFDIEKDGDFKRSMLTKKIEAFHKKPIRIRGFILPASVFGRKFDKFVLVRDNMECCFGPGAAIYDCIMIEMEKGKKAQFTTRSVTVEGVFRIKEYKYPDGKHFAIYHLDGRDVR